MYKKYSRRGFITVSGILSTLYSGFANSWGTDVFPEGLPDEKDVPDVKLVSELLKKNIPLVWLFTGDSITHGARHTLGWRSYPEIFGERVRWEMRRTRDLVINSGISGNITDNILNDFDWRVAQFKPAVVSVMIGTNDCVRDSISLDYYESKLEVLLNKIRGVNAIPILHTPTMVAINEAPQCKRLPEFVDVVKHVAEKRQVILVDNWYHWQDAFKKESELHRFKPWLDDPVHPNNMGHIEVARLLFKSLGIFDPAAFTCGGK